MELHNMDSVADVQSGPAPKTPQGYHSQPAGYNTPPRVAPPSSSLYNVMSNDRGSMISAPGGDVHSFHGDIRAIRYGYAPAPDMNGAPGAMKRGRDDEDELPRPGSGGLDMKHQKMTLGSPMPVASLYSRNRPYSHPQMPQTVTSNTLPHYGHQAPPLLQPGPGYDSSTSYLISPRPAPPAVSSSMGPAVLPPPDIHQLDTMDPQILPPISDTQTREPNERPPPYATERLPSLTLPQPPLAYPRGSLSPRVSSIESSISSNGDSQSSFTSVTSALSSNGPKTPPPNLPVEGISGSPKYDQYSTMNSAGTEMYYPQHMSTKPALTPQTVTSNTLSYYGHQAPSLLQPGSAYDEPASYLTSPQPASPAVKYSIGPVVLLPPGVHQPEIQSNYQGMDTTGQIAPPGMKPRVTASLWEDEGSLCFQVEARGVCVARREDNDMINGTKLLNVAGTTRGRRDGILKSEKIRHIVKIGPMHLKGVWIPFERALDFANKEQITEMLYPLFVHNIGDLLFHPINQSRTDQLMAAAERRKAEKDQLRSAPGPVSPSQNVSQSSLPWHSSSDRLSPARTTAFLTPSTSASSGMSSMSSNNFQWGQQGMSGAPSANAMPIDTGLSNARSMPATLITPPSDDGWNVMTMTFGYPQKKMSNAPSVNAMPINTGPSNAKSISATPATTPPITPLRKGIQPHESQNKASNPPTVHQAESEEPCDSLQSPQEETGGRQVSPSLVSPHSDSDASTSSSDEEHGFLTREEQKQFLLDRLMAYFDSLLSLCRYPGSPVRSVAAQSSSSGSHAHPSTSDSSPGETQSNHASSQDSSQSSGKRPRADEDKNEGDGTRDTKRQRPAGRPTRAKRFACPYFKRDPEQFQIRQSCPGPGWETMHRLKEHLYRNHQQPIRCRRCYMSFETDMDYDAHMRSTDRCENRPPPEQTDGFNAMQKNRLRSRPKGYKSMSEAQKWRHVYLILFPETRESDIPSPYYEFRTPGDAGHPVDPLTEYENFLQRELPPLVRSQLEARIEAALYPVEEALRGQIVDIVRDTQVELFRCFTSSTQQRSRPPNDEASAAEAARGGPGERVEATQDRPDGEQPPPTSTSAWPEQLEAYRPPDPFLDDQWGMLEFDGQLYDFGQMMRDESFADSAYGTISAGSFGQKSDVTNEPQST